MSFNITPVVSGYQEIHPYSAMNMDSVKINTSLIMMKECIMWQCDNVTMYNVTLWQCIIPCVHFVQLPIIHLNPIQPLPPTHPPWITETINLEKQWENFWIFTPVLPIFKLSRKKKTLSAVIANAVSYHSLWKGHCEILGLLCLTVNNVTIILGRVRSDQIEMT